MDGLLDNEVLLRFYPEHFNSIHISHSASEWSQSSLLQIVQKIIPQLHKHHNVLANPHIRLEGIGECHNTSGRT